MQVDYSKYYWQDGLVRLRKGGLEDWGFLYASMFDSPARVLYDLEIDLPHDEEAAKASWASFLEGDKSGKSFVFMIESHDGELLGSAYLFGIDERHGHFSAGITLAPEHRGKGYGSSALRLVFDYAFNERRMHKYNGFIIEGNAASEALLKKFGCVFEGRRRENIYHQGRYIDELHYGLTFDEFNSL